MPPTTDELPAALRGNPVVRANILVVITAALTYFALAHSLGLLLESAFLALFVLPFLGLHMLLSHIWLICMLLTLTVDPVARPLLVTTVGVFGYIAVGVPWYVAMCICGGKRVFFPRLVCPQWACWLILQVGKYSPKAVRDCELLALRMHWRVNKVLFAAVFHLLDFIMHLFPAITAIRVANRGLLPTAVVIGLALQILWFILIDRSHRTVYLGELPRGRIYLTTQPRLKRPQRAFGFVNTDSFRTIYGLDSAEAHKAFGVAELYPCLLAGWAVALLFVFQPGALDYAALRSVVSDAMLQRAWLSTAVAALPFMMGSVALGLPAVIGWSMEVA